METSTAVDELSHRFPVWGTKEPLLQVPHRGGLAKTSVSDTPLARAIDDTAASTVAYEAFWPNAPSAASDAASAAI